MHTRTQRNVLSLRIGLCQSAVISKQPFFKKNILVDSTGPKAEAQAAVQAIFGEPSPQREGCRVHPACAACP